MIAFARFKLLKGKLKDDQKECKNQYGVSMRVLNADSDGNKGYVSEALAGRFDCLSIKYKPSLLRA
jgi:hypothetical protein